MRLKDEEERKKSRIGEEMRVEREKQKSMER